MHGCIQGASPDARIGRYHCRLGGNGIPRQHFDLRFPDQRRDKEKLIIGLLGYLERATDAESLKTVYIEDNRGA
ncbi:MAG: hypothetical protein ACFNKE_06865 [Neisseria elongata]|jgi:hypothetical protein